MKIINAAWEKRNLGVTTQEIQVEQNDSLEDFKSAILSLDSQYNVVKIPAGKVEMMFYLQEQGFKFIEGFVHLTHSLHDIDLNPIQKRLDDTVSYEIMNQNDVAQLFSEIKNGLFYTDRIFLDSYFKNEQAQQRYINWISDELERGTELYKLVYKNESIGFFTFKQIADGIYYPFLAGVYKKWQSTGLGAVFCYKPIVEAKRRNAKQISTYVSTNNANTLRVHSSLGFATESISYVFVRHVGEN